MKFNYQTILPTLEELNDKMNDLITSFSKVVELNILEVCNENNWDSKTEEHYRDLYNDIVENQFVVINKCSNVVEYLSNVVSNYVATEKMMASSFDTVKSASISNNNEYLNSSNQDM